MVRFELRRAETVCSLAITYQHDLARPKLDEAAAAKRLHMHKNIGSLRAASAPSPSLSRSGLSQAGARFFAAG